MVKIRLTRTGKRHQPHYRVIAIQAKTKRDGKALEYLGYYNPRTSPSTVDLDAERIKFWLGNGAQPTETVSNLLIKEGILKAPKIKKVYKKEAGRKKQAQMEGKEASAPVADKQPEKKTDEPKAEEKAAETAAAEKSESKEAKTE